MSNLKAEKLFSLYGNQVEKSVAFYNRLMMRTPGVMYPTLARKIWKEGMLAEIWGTLATRLSGNRINYIQNWREGK